MTAVCAVHPDPSVRPDHVTRLAEYLRQYPQDIVDTKQLLKRFQVSAVEFEHALLRAQLEEGMGAVSATAPGPSVRPDQVHTLLAHLRRYPQDLVDAKRLLKRLRASAEEFERALRRIDEDSQSG
jgi:hypothetical protein